MTEKTEDLIAEARAERDAALAAIERVRVEADAYAEQPDVMEPCGAVAQALRTALDGAPEPEWEYGVWNERWAMYPHQERPYPSLAEAQQEASRFPSRRHVVRRRKAGTWEPVGGEG